VTTLVAQMGALYGRIDLAHAHAKEPWLQAGRVVDGIANRLREKVKAAKDELERRLTAYQTEKQARIEAERAKDRESYEEKDDPEPAWVDRAAQDRQHVTIRSVEGASSHLQKDVDIVVADPRKVPIRYLRRPKVLAAIIAEVRADVRKGDKIAGISSETVSKSRVRRG
jgi:hypothetical protein